MHRHVVVDGGEKWGGLVSFDLASVIVPTDRAVNTGLILTELLITWFGSTPVPWLEISEGSGAVLSTAGDLTRYLRSLAAAARGQGGFGLAPQQALAFSTHSVPSGEGDMGYGNGLMHVTDPGANYLHHTGGGPFGSAAFHLDPATGIGAFAGTTISGFAGYRPSKLTLFAVRAMAAARAGRPLPPHDALEAVLANAATFAGRYCAGKHTFTVEAGRTLLLRSDGARFPCNLGAMTCPAPLTPFSLTSRSSSSG